MYFFARSMVIGGSLGQLLAPPAGEDVDAEDASEDEAEDEPEDAEAEDEVGAEAVLPEDAEDPAAEPTVPEEAQPDSRSVPVAVTTPMPVL